MFWFGIVKEKRECFWGCFGHEKLLVMCEKNGRKYEEETRVFMLKESLNT